MVKILITGQIRKGEKKTERVYDYVEVPEKTLTMGFVVDALEKKYGSLEGYDLWHSAHTTPFPLNLPLNMLDHSVNSLELRAKQKVSSSKKKRQCKLAFQLPDAGRVQGQFFLSDSLWECLVKVEQTLKKEKPKANLLNRKTQVGTYEQPCLTAMGQQFNDIKSLQSTTLKKLGLRKKDTLLIRMSFKPTKIPFEQAQSSMPKVEDQKEQPKKEVKKTEPKPQTQPQKPQKPQPMQDETIVDLDDKMIDEQFELEKRVIQDKDVVVKFEKKMVAKEVKLFMAGTGKEDDTPITAEDFKMTADRLKAIYATQQRSMRDRQVFRSRSQDHVTKEREYETTLIRVRFPSGLIVQANLKPKNKIKRIRQLLDELLIGDKLPYYLYTTPPRVVYDDADASLKKLGLVPAVMMNIGIKTNQKLTIKEKYSSYIQNLSEQNVPEGKNKTAQIEKKANKLFKSLFGKKKQFKGQGRVLGA